MPITAEEARARALARQQRALLAEQPRAQAQPAPIQHDNFIGNVFGTIGTSITAVASSALQPIVDTFQAVPALQGHGALAATPVKLPDIHAQGHDPVPVQQHRGPLAAAGSPRGHRGVKALMPDPAPAVLIEDLQIDEPLHPVSYQCPFPPEIQEKAKRKSGVFKGSRRSSIFMAIVEESVLEETPVLAVLEVPDLQCERTRSSLYAPPPPQEFVIEDLQADSRRYCRPANLGFDSLRLWD